MRAAAFLCPLACSLLAWLPPAQAEVLEARVTHIGDGDSLSVCINGREARVRLVGIDAPEYRQRFGREARQSLAQLCEGRVARLQWEQEDRYERLLARVSCQGLDANAEQVRRGMAWVSDLDAPDGGFNAAQQAARARGLGLWADPNPLEPWKWRRADRTEKKPQRTSAAPAREARECAP